MEITVEKCVPKVLLIELSNCWLSMYVSCYRITAAVAITDFRMRLANFRLKMKRCCCSSIFIFGSYCSLNAFVFEIAHQSRECQARFYFFLLLSWFFFLILGRLSYIIVNWYGFVFMKECSRENCLLSFFRFDFVVKTMIHLKSAHSHKINRK